MDTYCNVLIVGATGLVGQRLLEILIDKKFPINNLKLVASASSVGRKLVIKDKEYIVEELNERSFDDIDFCFFCSNATVSKEWGNIASKKCKYVIDNSSAYRMKRDVPLVIPEINYPKENFKYMANPNCSIIQSLLVINEISKVYKINRIIYSTYQSCSGGGRKELFELFSSRDSKEKKLFDYYLCDTCLSHIGELYENQYSSEEFKMINETKKILDDYKIEVHASCIRVPVPYCHGVFIYLEINEDVDLNLIVNQFHKSNRISYIEDKLMYFQEAYNSEKVIVGKLKKDLDKNNALSLFCIGDNLHVGAAYNAYNIALYILRDNNEKFKKRTT